MRDYAKVRAAFWTGRTGRAIRRLVPPPLRLAAWAVASYLISNRHANMIGLYELPVPFLAHEIGISEDEAVEALTALRGLQFCDYDRDTEVVWVFEMARFQVLEDPDGVHPLAAKDNRVKGIANVYASIPENRFLGPFFDRYREVFHMTEKRGTGQQALPLVEAPPLQGREAPRGAASQGATEAPPKPGAGAGAGAGPKDTPARERAEVHTVDWMDRPKPTEVTLEQARRVDPDAVKQKRRGSTKGVLWGESRELFDAFWDAFAYKNGKQEAIGAWLDLETDGTLTPDLVRAKILPAARAEAVRRARNKPPEQGGPTPKMAEGWLSSARFDDEALVGEDPERAAKRAARGQEEQDREKLDRTLRQARGYGIDASVLLRLPNETIEQQQHRVDGLIGDAHRAKLTGGG